MSIASRFAQGLAGLRPRLPADRDMILTMALTEPQREAFLMLPVYDQRHLCDAYRFLRDSGVRDPELLRATLLHDLGKSALGGRVTLLDRTLNVLLGQFAPGLLHQLARLPAPGWRRGFALAAHHPRLGAEWAAGLGCSQRTCWLIAHHADRPAPDDPDLALLIAADRSAS